MKERRLSKVPISLKTKLEINLSLGRFWGREVSEKSGVEDKGGKPVKS